MNKTNVKPNEHALRCHFTSTITATLKTTWALLGFIVVMITSGWEKGDKISSLLAWLAVGALIIIVAAIFIINWLRWRRTYIWIDGDELVMNRQLYFNASRKTLRLNSIASINLKQGILERLFGTSRLQFDINSAATADSTDFDLTFDNKTAQWLRKEIESHRDGQTAAARVAAGSDDMVSLHTETAAAPESSVAAAAVNDSAAAAKTAVSGSAAAAENSSPEEILRRFGLGEVIRHTVLSLSAWSIGYTIVAVPLIIWSNSLGELQTGGRLNVQVLLSWALALWPLLLQTVKPLLRYYGFTLARCGDEVLVYCGLLTRHQFTLPLARTNAVLIKEPMLGRFCGYAYGEIINVGMGDTEDGMLPAFSLLVKKSELAELLAQLAPQFIVNVQLESSPRQILPVCLLRYGCWALPVLPVAFFLGYWWAGALLLILLLVGGAASWSTKGLALDTKLLAVSYGVFARTTMITDYSRLQNIQYGSGPLSRRLQLYQGTVFILASLARSQHTIGWFPAARFAAIEQKMLQSASTGIYRNSDSQL